MVFKCHWIKKHIEFFRIHFLCHDTFSLGEISQSLWSVFYIKGWQENSFKSRKTVLNLYENKNTVVYSFGHPSNIVTAVTSWCLFPTKTSNPSVSWLVIQVILSNIWLTALYHPFPFNNPTNMYLTTFNHGLETHLNQPLQVTPDSDFWDNSQAFECFSFYLNVQKNACNVHYLKVGPFCKKMKPL